VFINIVMKIELGLREFQQQLKDDLPHLYNASLVVGTALFLVSSLLALAQSLTLSARLMLFNSALLLLLALLIREAARQ
jgi:hypothetical protein